MEDYSTERATALLKLFKQLRKLVRTPNKYTYIDKVSIAITVSESYLNLSQAFKVDDTLWKKARKDLDLIVKYIKNEQKIDKVFELLADHLDKYMEALNTWT